jgi:hypothetical protein
MLSDDKAWLEGYYCKDVPIEINPSKRRNLLGVRDIEYTNPCGLDETHKVRTYICVREVWFFVFVDFLSFRFHALCISPSVLSVSFHMVYILLPFPKEELAFI